jgi:type III pantothenate kinase
MAIADLAEAARAIADLAQAGTPVVVASVNDAAAATLEQVLGDLRVRLYRIGRDLAIDLRHTVDDIKGVGQDRLLCAIGAFQQARQACVVVDAGTAVTVDFIDGEGVFHGGAIAPGASMMLSALHERTAGLPEVEFASLDEGASAFGRNTRDAMLLGVHGAIVGLVHHLVERYATFYDAYPQIVATGGDAPALFENDPIIEHIVPDLQLVGIHTACARALADDD